MEEVADEAEYIQTVREALRTLGVRALVNRQAVGQAPPVGPDKITVGNVGRRPAIRRFSSAQVALTLTAAKSTISAMSKPITRRAALFTAASTALGQSGTKRYLYLSMPDGAQK